MSEGVNRMEKLSIRFNAAWKKILLVDEKKVEKKPIE